MTAALKARTRQAGFALVGVCPAVSPAAGQHRFHAWLDAGYAGELHYLATRWDAYEHPGHIRDGRRSLVMRGMHYRTSRKGDGIRRLLIGKRNKGGDSAHNI